LLVPGTIVVVDDDDEAETTLVKPLRNKGEHVLLYKKIPRNSTSFQNVRLVIIDWDLSGSEQLEPNVNGPMVVRNIEKILGSNRFCMVAIWSIYGDSEENRKLMRDAVFDLFNSKHPGAKLNPNNLIILGTKINSSKTEEEITKWLNDNHSAGIIYEWEKSLENARDKFTSKIYDNNLNNIIKLYSKYIGAEASVRQLSNLFIKLLLREIYLDVPTYTKKIDIINGKKGDDVDGENNLDWYSRYYYLQSYYVPLKNEPIMTGNIFLLDKKNPNKVDNYGVVLNCLCDFYNKKVNNIKLLRGSKISNLPEYTADKVTKGMHIPYEYGNYVTYDEHIKQHVSKYHGKKDFIDKFFNNKLKESYYKLLFVKTNPQNKKYYHLIFDYNKINYEKVKLNETFTPQIPDNWKRICSLDSPLTEDLLQNYASFCSRIGVPPIPEKYIITEKHRLKTKGEEEKPTV